jgi:hypothetical protein
VVAELLLANRARRINLVAEDQEWNLAKLLDREKRVKLRLGLRETLKVGRVNEENDTVDLGEVVPPEAAGWCQDKCVNLRLSSFQITIFELTLLMSTKIICCEFHAPDREFLRSLKSR